MKAPTTKEEAYAILDKLVVAAKQHKSQIALAAAEYNEVISCTNYPYLDEEIDETVTLCQEHPLDHQVQFLSGIDAFLQLLKDDTEQWAVTRDKAIFRYFKYKDVTFVQLDHLPEEKE